MDPEVPGHLCDGLAGLDHHLHRLSLELSTEPATLFGPEHILSFERTCPRSLVHLIVPYGARTLDGVSVELEPVRDLHVGIPSPVEELVDDRLYPYGLRMFLRRDDLIHPDFPGNKWRKLKYNLAAARVGGL